MAILISGKKIFLHNLGGNEFVAKYGFKCPTGVRGRNSDNTLYHEKINWVVSKPLTEGMNKTYYWIKAQVDKSEKLIR